MPATPNATGDESATKSDPATLYDQNGIWVASRQGRALFNRRGEMVGVFGPDHEHAFDREGKYLATQLGDRLLQHEVCSFAAPEDLDFLDWTQRVDLPDPETQSKWELPHVGMDVDEAINDTPIFDLW